MKPVSVMDFSEQVGSGAVSIVEHTHKVLDEAEKQNKKFNHFSLISRDEALLQAAALQKNLEKNPKEYKNALLLGVSLSVKDSICVSNVESRAGSAILSGYVPLFDATVISRAKAAGAIVIGKTSQDEFGFGSYCVNVGNGFKVPKNPFDEKRTTGGSSGGSAGYTSLTKFPHLSFAESTGGSAACPASFCGCATITPTYGRLSRNGLIDFGNSLDKISPMAKTIREAAVLLEAVAGIDPKDSTSADQPVESFSVAAGKGVKNLRIAVVSDFVSEGIDPVVAKIFGQAVEKLKSDGAKVSEVSLPQNREFSIPTYYLIATSEVSTNLARYCGMRFGATEPLNGNFNTFFSSVRSKYFGEEAKRRLLLGTFCRMSGYRDAYYLRALKVRSKLIAEFQSAFKKADLLVLPTMSTIAPTFDEIKKWSPLQHYYADKQVNPPNVSGLPHASVNIGIHKGLPVGLLLLSNHWQESLLVQAGSAVEKPLEGI